MSWVLNACVSSFRALTGPRGTSLGRTTSRDIVSLRQAKGTGSPLSVGWSSIVRAGG
eukprot:CAMPEP_0179195666 /NCGR_PEP_ID=MMETSP0796-20121207/97268_1 /TAXON_ID=73915 /ORGANISM="Pyrodinium bahamense, Strain pbaha01" /LENGTH=56 /DNA_ID=CAMNT_0020900025 /DNA_START=978 /DNA_END=1144 /DNA_ORIENTATION=-